MTSGLIMALPMFAAWAAFFLLSRELAARGWLPEDWRGRWLAASVAWGVAATWLVELASLAKMVNASVLVAGWILVTIGAGLCWDRLRLFRIHMMPAKVPPPSERVALASDLAAPSDRPSWFRLLPWDVWLGLAGMALLVALLGVVAATTANTNSDSLTYHLPRVMHWIQDQSVAFYPTNNCRQNEFGPWSSYAMLHLHLLLGNDYGDNLVQWFAMLTSAIGVAYLSTLFLKEENAATRQRVAVLAAVLVLSLPNAVSEAVSTQNDLVTVAWMVCAMVFTFWLWRTPQSVFHSLGLGLALGLGVLTKASTYFLAIPLVAVVGCWVWRSRNHPASGKLLAGMGVAFLAVCGPFLVRNYSLMGSPVSCDKLMALERNRVVTVPGTASNVLRNLSLHTNTGIAPLTRLLQRGVVALHQFTGRDLNDPDLTYDEYPFSFKTRFYVFDSYGSGFYHLVLIVAAGVIALLRAPWRRPFWLGFAGAALSFVMFCALLRWQVWHTRIHLAYFIMLAPMVAAVLGVALRRFHITLTLPLLALGFLCLFINSSRPILNPVFRAMPREQQYGAIHGRVLYEPMKEAAALIVRSGCRNLGLKLQFDDLEYPMWVILRNSGFKGRLEHVLVEDVSGKLPRNTPMPDAMLTTFKRTPPDYVTRHFPHYTDHGMLRVYWSKPPPGTDRRIRKPE